MMLHDLFVNCLLNHFTYSQVLAIKSITTDLSAFFLGVMTAILVISKVATDSSRILDEDTEPGEVRVTKIKKNGKTRVLVSVNPTEMYGMSTITLVMLTFRSVIVRLIPFVKNLHMINSRNVRIRSTLIFIIMVLIFTFFVTMDSHVVLPNGQGGYDVKDIMNASK